MNLYEHTIIARQDVSPTQLKQIAEKYSKIVQKNEGNVVKLAESVAYPYATVSPRLFNKK